MKSNLKRTFKAFLSIACAACLPANFAFGEALIVVNEITGNQVTAVGGQTSAADHAIEFSGIPGAVAFDLTMDTAADVLLIAAELSVTSGTVFDISSADNHPSLDWWSHTTQPPICILPFCGFPPALYDNWRIITPGIGNAADNSDLLAGNRVVHFDTTDEGPQSGFNFASFTLLPDEQGQAEAILDLQIQTAAQPTPVFDNVSVTMSIVPEPDARILTVIGFIVFFMARRRLR